MGRILTGVFTALMLARLMARPLVFLAADDGGGSGGGAGGSGGGSSIQTDPPGQGGTGSGGDPGTGAGSDDRESSKPKPSTVTLTQAELDALIAREKAAAKKAAEDAAKQAAERAKMDEAERLKAEKADAEKAAEAAKREALAAKVEVAAERAALAAQVDPGKVDRFLRLVDLADLEAVTVDGKPDGDAIKKAVESTLADFPEFKAAAGGGRSGGDFNGADDKRPKTLQDAVARRLAG